MRKCAFAFYAIFILEAAGGFMQGMLGGSVTQGAQAPSKWAAHEAFMQEGTDPTGFALSG